jgi:hypothetical protein
MFMDTKALSFAFLDEKVSQFAKDTDIDERPGKLERWSMAVGWIGGGVGLVVVKVLSGRLALLLSVTALVVELVGLGIGVAFLIRRELRSFRRPHAQFSRELDQAYGFYRELVTSLSTFPKAELQRRLRYLKARKATLMYRTGLFTGSMERLGVLPILVALYVQFKDWEFGNWASLWANVHLVGGLLLWALLLAYMGSWWLIRLRSRLDVYEALLDEALEEGACAGSLGRNLDQCAAPTG